MAGPWLHPCNPPQDALTGYVVVRGDGAYWTGVGEDLEWSHNPRRALVDYLAPWAENTVRGGRCVMVLLEDEVTMLPLRHWPK